MEPKPRPWWAPDAQGFLAMAIVLICGTALFVRMFHPSGTEDKMLDTMITILFSTCLVTVYQFSFGSSRGSAIKDEAQSRVVQQLAAVVPPPIAPPPAAPPATPWWTQITEAERSAILAQRSDARVAAFITAAQAGSASAEQLDYLVSRGLLTRERASAIAAA